MDTVLDQTELWRVDTCDVFAGLASLPDGCVNCVVTSPPYYSLRDYGVEGQIGLEETPAMYVAKLVDVFKEVRRVLRDDGVFWLNMGDSYSNDAKWGGSSGMEKNRGFPRKSSRGNSGLKAGDLMGMPWQLAFALRADGWYIRADDIWGKKTPMPESVNGWRYERCRVKVRSADWCEGDDFVKRHCGPAEYEECPGCKKCESNDGYVLRRGAWRRTRAHEYLFMLTKSDTYFCDATAVAEQSTGHDHGENSHVKVGDRANGVRNNGDFVGAISGEVETRNPRSVLMLSNPGFKEAHFATFPPALVEPLIKACTSEMGHCPSCGSPVLRIIERTRRATRPGEKTKVNVPSGWDTSEGDHGKMTGRYRASTEVGNRDPRRYVTSIETKGWRRSCWCDFEIDDAQPALVLDPFTGAGTTGLVARRLGQRFIGFELKEEYAEIARKRIAGDRKAMPLFDK